MKKQKLINAIRETIIDLETGRRNYVWCDQSACNCGLLANNLGANTVFKMPEKQSGLAYYGSWVVCHQTGKMYSDVIELMLSAGMSYSDIIHLENLSDEKILQEAGISLDVLHPLSGVPINTYRSHKETVIQYFRTWLRILEREEAPQPQPEPQYRTVVIDTKVKSLTQEKVSLS